MVTDTQGAAFDFHATAIADGSRRIAVGTEVSFVVTPGHRGRYEARGLTRVGPPPED
jgi:cold shock CspA family protein